MNYRNTYFYTNVQYNIQNIYCIFKVDLKIVQNCLNALIIYFTYKTQDCGCFERISLAILVKIIL